MSEKLKKFGKSINFSKTLNTIFILLPVGVLINLGITYFLTDKSDYQRLKTFALPHLLLAAGMALVPWLTHTLRLKLWTRFFDEDISFWKLFRISVGTTLGQAVSPTALGGGPFKVGMLIEEDIRPTRAITLSILGSVEDGAFLLLAVPLAFFLAPPQAVQSLVVEASSRFHPSLLLTLPIAGILIWLSIKYRSRWDRILKHLPFYESIKEGLRAQLDNLRETFELIKNRGKTTFLCTMLLSILQWTCWYSIVYIILLGLGIEANPAHVLILQCLVVVGMLVVPTPGAVGGAEAIFLLLYGTLLTEKSIALVTVGWRFLTFYEPLILGAIVFALLRLNSVKVNLCSDS